MKQKKSRPFFAADKGRIGNECSVQFKPDPPALEHAGNMT
jgi:hypothetical protein